ncbi:hypothetical protein GC197_11955 [bacterium]|nr:hypothetical protein [bacterium]
MHWIVALTLLVGADAEAAKPDPVSAYQQIKVRGWDVYVHKSLLLEQKETGDAIQELIDHQLYEIQRRLPKQAVSHLQKMPIWIEYENPRTDLCACYHTSADWLAENGFLREKAKAVEIAHAKEFLQQTIAQPFMLLHEMSHGYHDQVLGYDNSDVLATYKQAKKSKAYDQVRHIEGSLREAYAIEDEKEYFSECTEAYFGTNDFYPFVKAELKQHDVEGFHLMEKLWNGKPEAETSADSN